MVDKVAKAKYVGGKVAQFLVGFFFLSKYFPLKVFAFYFFYLVFNYSETILFFAFTLFSKVVVTMVYSYQEVIATHCIPVL